MPYGLLRIYLTRNYCTISCRTTVGQPDLHQKVSVPKCLRAVPFKCGGGGGGGGEERKVF